MGRCQRVRSKSARSTASAAIRDASDAISDTSLDGVVRDVEAFARRNPLLVAAGAAALGFALARAAKASQRRRVPDRFREGDPR